MPPKPEIAGGGLNKYQDVSRGATQDVLERVLVGNTRTPAPLQFHTKKN